MPLSHGAQAKCSMGASGIGLSIEGLASAENAGNFIHGILAVEFEYKPGMSVRIGFKRTAWT